MADYAKGIFLRYRSGVTIINPDIKEKVTKLLPLLIENKTNLLPFLRMHLKYTSETEYGVDNESTWDAAVLELFSQYERYDGSPISEETKDALFGLLSLLIEGDENVQLDWNKIREYIIDNIDYLAPMPDRSYIFDGEEVSRDKNGIYYYNDKELGRVEVHGLKTPPEEMLEYYTNETQRRYGRLYHILKFVALFDIAFEYKHNPDDFPDKLSCTLYDNNGQTSYLEWQWQMPTPFDFVPMQWYPRSPFSNPDWLGSDLVMHLPFPNANPNEPIVTTAPTNKDIENWRNAFGGFKWQIEIPISSNVLIGDDSEAYFEFFDRTVRWVNGNAFVQSMLIVPANDEDGADGIEIARKFLSVMNLGHDVKLSEQLISQQQPRYLPWFRQTRMGVFEKFDERFILPADDYSKYSIKKWYALAFIREAVSSNSIYYSFLNYFKVVELANTAKDTSKAKEWINANIERVCNEKNLSWYQKVVIEGGEKDPGRYLSKTERTAIAHAEYTDKGAKTHNPDDPVDWKRTQEDLVIMRVLARDILKTF